MIQGTDENLSSFPSKVCIPKVLMYHLTCIDVMNLFDTILWEYIGEYAPSLFLWAFNPSSYNVGVFIVHGFIEHIIQPIKSEHFSSSIDHFSLRKTINDACVNLD